MLSYLLIVTWSASGLGKGEESPTFCTLITSLHLLVQNLSDYRLSQVPTYHNLHPHIPYLSTHKLSFSTFLSPAMGQPWSASFPSSLAFHLLKCPTLKPCLSVLLHGISLLLSSVTVYPCIHVLISCNQPSLGGWCFCVSVRDVYLALLV